MPLTTAGTRSTIAPAAILGRRARRDGPHDRTVRIQAIAAHRRPVCISRKTSPQVSRGINPKTGLNINLNISRGTIPEIRRRARPLPM